jgi:hypothetical protein
MGFDGMAWLANKATAQALVRTMLSAKPPADGWRGVEATPPGTALDVLLKAFERNTDIPLELPFFTFLHYLTGILLANGTRISGPMGPMHPELWTIVLAPSGSGKSFTNKIIQDNSPVQSEFPEPATGPKFIEDLAATSPALWFQDEIAQKLKLIEKAGSPLSECKEYLLRAYDNRKIERATKVETITIDEPVLGILGINTPESFKKALSPESLLDGFAQRFGFVWAEKDPKRRMEDHPIYAVAELNKAAAQAFALINATPLHKKYVVNEEGTHAYRQAFRTLAQPGVPESFYRRALFRAFKYATLYHIILGKTSDQIDAEDVGWGAKLCQLHIQDMGKVIDDGGMDQTAKAVSQARALKAKCEAAGKPFGARELQQGIRSITTASEAAIVLGMI